MITTIFIAHVKIKIHIAETYTELPKLCGLKKYKAHLFVSYRRRQIQAIPEDNKNMPFTEKNIIRPEKGHIDLGPRAK